MKREHATHLQYGLPEQLSQLDSEQQEVLSDAFNSMPEWGSQGPFCCEDPGPATAGRIQVDLFKKEAPKAVENFLCLCTGERDLGKSSKKHLYYKVWYHSHLLLLVGTMSTFFHPGTSCLVLHQSSK